MLTSIAFIITDIIITEYQNFNFLENPLLHLVIPVRHQYLEYIISLEGRMVFQEYYQYIFLNFIDQKRISIHPKVFYLNKMNLSKVKLKSIFVPVS